MKVLIIEDEAPAYRRLHTLLQELEPDAEVLDVVDSIEQACQWFEANPQPDLVFSDIQLADGLSFEIYEQVQVHCPVIFTTAFDEYTLQAFRVNSIDYLLKPIAQEDLKRSLDKWQRLTKQSATTDNSHLAKLLSQFQQKTYRSRFLVKVGDRLLSIAVADIAYFSSVDGLTYLHTRAGKKYVVDDPLEQLETDLDPKLFHRLNRQVFCHLESIGTVHQYFKGKLKVELAPAPDHDVVVSRERAAAFKRWLAGLTEQ